MPSSTMPGTLEVRSLVCKPLAPPLRELLYVARDAGETHRDARHIEQEKAKVAVAEGVLCFVSKLAYRSSVCYICIRFLECVGVYSVLRVLVCVLVVLVLFVIVISEVVLKLRSA